MSTAHQPDSMMTRMTTIMKMIKVPPVNFSFRSRSRISGDEVASLFACALRTPVDFGDQYFGDLSDFGDVDLDDFVCT